MKPPANPRALRTNLPRPAAEVLGKKKAASRELKTLALNLPEKKEGTRRTLKSGASSNRSNYNA